MSTKHRDLRPQARQKITPARQPLPSGRALWLRQYWYVVAGIVVLIAAVVWVAYETTRPSPGRAQLTEPASHVPEGSPISSGNRPPSSGSHYPSWQQPYGVYEEEVPTGRWIHNLEHGAIVILYKCDGGAKGCPDLVEQLRQLYATAPLSKYRTVKIIATPYTQIDYKIAVVAWGRLDEMDEFDRDRILRFYKAYLDRGPEDAQ